MLAALQLGRGVIELLENSERQKKVKGRESNTHSPTERREA